MDAESVSSSESMNAGTQNFLRIVLGLLLLLPAVWFLITTLLLPIIQTVNNSLLKMQTVGSGKSDYVGLDNYTHVFQSPFGSALGFTLMLALGRIVAVGVLPPLLALALSRFGRNVRIPIRLLFSIPVALFAPVLTLLSWRLALNPQFGLLGSLQRTPLLASPSTAPAILVVIDTLTTFGLACGVGLVVYLIALRNSAESNSARSVLKRPAVVVWLVSLITVVALVLQEMLISYVLTGGGPGNSTTTLAFLNYRTAFQFFQGGLASAFNVLMLLVLALMGLIAGILIVYSGVRLETVRWITDEDLPDWSVRQRVLPGLVVGIIVCLGIVILAILPQIWIWLAKPSIRPGGIQQPITLASLQDLLNLIAPAAVPVLLIQLPVAYLAALGIGALRPLGRYSEWLLLIVSPFLFVTILPLGFTLFLNLRQVGLVNTEAALTIPRIMLGVPMLFILTLFFKGQERQWRAAQASGQSAIGSFVTTVILPSLPLAALLALVTIAVSQMDLLWPLLAVNSPALMPLPVRLVQMGAAFSASSDSLVVELIRFGVPLFVLSLLVLIPFQIFYFDRLALRTGDDSPA